MSESPGSQNPQTASAAEGDTAPTEQQPQAGSPAPGEPGGSSYGQSGAASGPEEASVGIGDDQLPEDLRPSDDNPLAKPPSDDDTPSGVSLTDGDDVAQGGAGL